MKLQYNAITIANLEDELDIKLLELFMDEDAIKKTVMSMRRLLALISAGYNNDLEMGNKVLMEELAKGRNQGEIFEEVVTALQEVHFLPVAEENPQVNQKLKHGTELSKANGKMEKKQPSV